MRSLEDVLQHAERDPTGTIRNMHDYLEEVQVISYKVGLLRN